MGRLDQRRTDRRVDRRWLRRDPAFGIQKLRNVIDPSSYADAKAYLVRHHAERSALDALQD